MKIQRVFFGIGLAIAGGCILAGLATGHPGWSIPATAGAWLAGQSWAYMSVRRWLDEPIDRRVHERREAEGREA